MSTSMQAELSMLYSRDGAAGCDSLMTASLTGTVPSSRAEPSLNDCVSCLVCSGVNRNDLYGKIPPCFNQLESLESL